MRNDESCVNCGHLITKDPLDGFWDHRQEHINFSVGYENCCDVLVNRKARKRCGCTKPKRLSLLEHSVDGGIRYEER